MADENLKLRKIRRALISVSDKTGIVDFARNLKAFGVEIVSTGGTAAALRSAGIDVVDVAQVTGFPEMMDGRIKTLHPRIHGALLALRDNSDHLSAMREHEINPIDLVVVNLYPFEETIKRADVKLSEAIEQIDIGGPAMIRSAAKNFEDVAVIVRPDIYPDISSEFAKHNGSLCLATRRRLAQEAFAQTARYDMLVTMYLLREQTEKETKSCASWSVGAVVDRDGLKSSVDAPRIDSEEFSIEAFRGSLPG